MAAPAPTFKLLLVGDSGTGKSSILLRFTDGEFDEEQAVTIGVDFRQQSLSVDNVECNLTLWDTVRAVFLFHVFCVCLFVCSPSFF
jgi:GTPase SAR1 family protein